MNKCQPVAAEGTFRRVRQLLYPWKPAAPFVSDRLAVTPLEAQMIIDALSRGVDPETAKPMPADSPLRNPHVVEALSMASRALGAKKPALDPEAERPGNAGQSWSPEEDRRLIEGFDQGATVQELAERHQRSNGGIAARLVRLGRIKERAQAYEPRST